VTDWRHYIAGPSGPIAVYIRKSSGTPAAMAYYLTKDHLGSIDSITDSGGAVNVRLSYNAFGVRRKEAGWVDADLPASDWAAVYAITHRGYTFHEMLDDLGLTHMNGRVYDQISVRFVSADPFGIEPNNTQSFNRYSYVMNSPLSYSDPSGYGNKGDPQLPANGTGFDEGVMGEVLVEGTRDSIGDVSVGGVSGSATGTAPGSERDDAMQTVTVTGHKPPKRPSVVVIWLNYLPDLMGLINSSDRKQTQGNQDQKCHSLGSSIKNNTEAHVGFGVGLGDKIKLGIASLNINLGHIYYGGFKSGNGQGGMYISWGGPALELRIWPVRIGGATTQYQTHVSNGVVTDTQEAGFLFKGEASSEFGQIGDTAHAAVLDIGGEVDLKAAFNEASCGGG
jgi:RHS repeat-associated protein